MTDNRLTCTRTKKFQALVVSATAINFITFAVLLVVWRGDSKPIDSLYVFGGGFATGIVHSALFVALTSQVEDDQVAIAGSGLYLSANIGALAGICISNASYQYTLAKQLNQLLANLPDKKKVSILIYSQLSLPVSSLLNLPRLSPTR